MRVGTGYDIHRLVGGRPLILGGVTIPYPLGPQGHSDGDALLHAIIDATLGAAGLGDIGRHFPPGDERWRGIASTRLAELTMEQVRLAGYEVGNVDATVILERPRLAPHLDLIRTSTAKAMGVREDQVNVKAKTNEGLDAVGEGRAVAAHAIVLLL